MKNTGIFILLMTASDAYFYNTPRHIQCMKLGGFNMVGGVKYFDNDSSGSISVGDMSVAAMDGSYLPVNGYPFYENINSYMMHQFKITASCTIVDLKAAPSCTMWLEMKMGRQCQFGRRRLQNGARNQYAALGAPPITPNPNGGVYGGVRCLSGKVHISGIGPHPYVIIGGTGDFFGAYGEMDSSFNQQTGDLSNISVDMCMSVPVT